MTALDVMVKIAISLFAGTMTEDQMAATDVLDVVNVTFAPTVDATSLTRTKQLAWIGALPPRLSDDMVIICRRSL